jgi:hypothetical protein
MVGGETAVGRENQQVELRQKSGWYIAILLHTKFIHVFLFV